MKIFLVRLLFTLIWLLFFADSIVKAQNLVKIDSLKNLILTTKVDSIKVYSNVYISKEFFKTDVIVSLEYGKKALEIAEKSNKPKLLSYALFNLGVGFFQQGLLELSIPYFFRYLEISKEMNDNKAIAYALVNIGSIHLQMSQLEEASDYFNQALEKFEKIYDNSQKPGKEAISIFNNLGVIARQRQQSDIAIEYYQKGISLARQTPGFKTELANLLNNLGNLYLDLGETKSSKKYLEEALELRVQNNDQTGLIKSYLSVAKFHKSQNNDEAALDNLYFALQLADKVGVISSKAESQEMLFETYRERQMPDSALKYHILYRDLNEIINKESALKEMKRLEVSSHFRESQKLLEVEIKRKETFYLLVGLILGLIILVLGLLYFLTYNRGRRQKLEKENILLNSKNIELEKANLESELEFKKKELATNIIYQVQNNEVIHNIIQKLQTIRDSNSGVNSEWVNEILKDLKKTQSKSVWDEFELRFQQVHNGFYKNLNEINPGLSTNERRLCAFLKLNMTTKEISSITGQSNRSIEVARTRLRKKLNLTNSDIGLVEFFSAL